MLSVLKYLRDGETDVVVEPNLAGLAVLVFQHRLPPLHQPRRVLEHHSKQFFPNQSKCPPTVL